VTRGRARVLQDAINGTLVKGLNDRAVRESLDLCLSCKACSNDCPSGVDMAAYKSEVLHRRYKGKPRPVAHYSIGWLPRWLKVIGVAPRVVNAVLNASLDSAHRGFGCGYGCPTLAPQICPHTFPPQPGGKAQGGGHDQMRFDGEPRGAVGRFVHGRHRAADP